jgi:hypothetical protein
MFIPKTILLLHTKVVKQKYFQLYFPSDFTRSTSPDQLIAQHSVSSPVSLPTSGTRFGHATFTQSCERCSFCQGAYLIPSCVSNTHVVFSPLYLSLSHTLSLHDVANVQRRGRAQWWVSAMTMPASGDVFFIFF